jgi:hypothetical protein
VKGHAIMVNPFSDTPALCGALRRPRQVLSEQRYDGHKSIHDDAMAGSLGLRAGPIDFDIVSRARATACGSAQPHPPRVKRGALPLAVRGLRSNRSGERAVPIRRSPPIERRHDLPG